MLLRNSERGGTVYTTDLKSVEEIHAGSNPAVRTNQMEFEMMSPLQMGIMLAAYSGNSGFLGCNNDTHVWRTQCQDLMNAGMIEPNSSNVPWHIKLTDKGKFWLDFVLGIQYPTKVCKYEIGGIK